MGFLLASLWRGRGGGCCSASSRLLSYRWEIVRWLSSRSRSRRIPFHNHKKNTDSDSDSYINGGSFRYPIPKDSDIESEEALWKLYERWRRELDMPAPTSPAEQEHQFNAFKKNAKYTNACNKLCKEMGLYETGLHGYAASTPEEMPPGLRPCFPRDLLPVDVWDN